MRGGVVSFCEKHLVGVVILAAQRRTTAILVLFLYP
jgi:hypothetical protein